MIDALITEGHAARVYKTMVMTHILIMIGRCTWYLPVLCLDPRGCFMTVTRAIVHTAYPLTCVVMRGVEYELSEMQLETGAFDRGRTDPRP